MLADCTDADVNCTDVLNCSEALLSFHLLAGACAVTRSDLTCALKR
jgi:hypothetical protein